MGRKGQTGTTQECSELSWTNPGGKKTTKQQLYGHLTPITKNHSSKMNKTSRTQLEKQRQTHKWRSSISPYTWTFQCRLTSKNLFTSALCRHNDVVWKTCREQWMIGTDGERERERERERESQENPSCQCDLMIMMMIFSRSVSHSVYQL